MFKLLKPKSSFQNERIKARNLVSKLVHLKFVKLVLIVIVTIISIPIVLILILKPKIQSNIRYGVTFSNKYAVSLDLNWQETYTAILDDLQVRNLRLITYWDDVEKTQNIYDYSTIKWQLDEAEKRNLNVILVLGRKVPRFPECFEPNWWKTQNDKHMKDIALYEYVRNTVQSLKDYKSIKMWQIENEPFFPFGICEKIEKETVLNEVGVVRNLDNRPILIQDSGEGGFWRPSYEMGNYLGISMYRRIWYNFWKIFLGKFIYFKYPLPSWSYKIKADLLGIPYRKIIVTELQAEPWGPNINSKLSETEKAKTMSPNAFLDTLSYSQKSGFGDLYLWGVEWWYWEKNINNNGFYWNAAKAFFE